MKKEEEGKKESNPELSKNELNSRSNSSHSEEEVQIPSPVKQSEGKPPLAGLSGLTLKKINSSPSLKQVDEANKKIEMAEMIDQLQEEIKHLKAELAKSKR